MKNTNLEEMKMLDYVCLGERYSCDKCIFNSKNKKNQYEYCFPYNLKYKFSNCNGNPCKRTQCKKRNWPFSTLLNLITAVIIVIAFIAILAQVQILALALAYTIAFSIGLDIVCCIIEYSVDKAWECAEKLRRRNYDKKVEKIEAINREKEMEKERKKERDNQLYKDIDEAKQVFSELSNKYLKKLRVKSDKEDGFIDLKYEVYKKYRELLKNIEAMLKRITVKDIQLSEVRTLFKIYIPNLCENINLYEQEVKGGNETKEQIQQLIRLLESFNIKVNQIKENLNNSDSESLVYKMQALRGVISQTKNEED